MEIKVASSVTDTRMWTVAQNLASCVVREGGALGMKEGRGLAEPRLLRGEGRRGAGAVRATVRARAEDTVMAAMLEVVEVWMCGRGREVRVGVR